jgi:class 3 adenylate cyclase/tetratricopeptide (TPR) repeat protein
MAGIARKTVTVLFADLVDSTPLGEALDPEQMRAIMGRYFAEMRTVIERHGGSIEKYIGDAVMAVFGIPSVHEDDALRAVRAAAEMRVALESLNRELVEPLAIRTGLATGEVVTGDGDTLVTGDAVNIAARLEQIAAPGEILAADETHQLVRDAVVAEPVEALTLKGRTAPVAAWRITAVVAGSPGRVRRFDTAIVGRADELALLRQAHTRAIASRACHLFTILGPAGVGKSRLTNEFLARADTHTTVLVGRCLPYGEGITYWPLREVVHAVGDIRVHVGDVDARVIEAAVGVGDAQAAPEDIGRALRHLLEAIARESALILVLEDIHWGEPALLDLIDHLAESTRDAPILLLCLARPELLDGRPSWGGGKVNATTILLEPLDAEHADKLVANLAGDVLEPAARQTITEVAEGNPLFLEEMVAMVVDDGAPGIVPPTIAALLAARLELLPAAERETLAVAAVVGRFFSTDAVVALAGEDARATLESLERKDLIRSQRVAFTHGDAYRFRHILIRDAGYDALPKAVRAELHENLADWLEQTASDQREVDEIVGWHLERAFALKRDLGTIDDTLASRAVASLTRVGRRALGRGDASAAATLLGRALALPGPRGPDRVETQLDLVAAQLERGELAHADELVTTAMDRAAELDEEGLAARALVERSYVLFHTDPEIWVQTTRKTVNAAREPLERAGDDVGLARAWMLLVLHDYISGRTGDLQTALGPALFHARRSGDLRHVNDLLTLAARSILFTSVPVADAIARCQKLMDEGGNRGVIHGVVACLHAMAGRFDDARLEYSAGRALLEEFGRTRLLAVHGTYGGAIELWAGDGVAAERALQRGARTLEAIGDRGTLATVAALLAAALHLQGRHDEALRWAEASRRDASTADLVSQVQWRTALARLVPERAVELAEKAVAVAAETDWTVLQADAALCLRDVLLSRGRTDEAARAAEQAAALYRAKGHVVGVQWVESPSLAAISASEAPTVAGGT